MTKLLIGSLLLGLAAAAMSSSSSYADNPPAAVAGGARIDGDFTLVWRQRVDDPAATTQPAVRVGDFAVDLRPAIKAKPKDPPAFQFALGGDVARSKTLIFPGKWYELAMVSTGGKVQLFVNGFPDQKPQQPP